MKKRKKHEELFYFMETQLNHYIQKTKDDLYEAYYFHIPDSEEHDSLMNHSIMSHAAGIATKKIIDKYKELYK